MVLPSAQPMYAAAARWRDEALIEDKSLFTREPLDGRRASSDLVRDFIEQPDASQDDFLSKLKGQLQQTSGDGVQAAAELLYIHCLIVSTEAFKSKNKIALVNDVADIAGAAHIPEDLLDALKGGVARPGTAYGTLRWKMLSYLIRVFEAIKDMPIEQRSQVLSDYERFQQMLDGIDDQSVWSQRYALEHLLFPSIAPAIVSRDDRRRIELVFSDQSERPLRPVRQIVRELEPNVEYGSGRGVNFYRTPYRERWKSADPMLHEYLTWSLKVASTQGILENERGYKIERVPLIQAAFTAAERGEDPYPALKKALTGFNVINYRVTHEFLAWAKDQPQAVAGALLPLAHRPGPESIDRFLEAIPWETLSGHGARLSVASTLAMGLAPADFPPWRDRVAETTRRLTRGNRAQEAATEGERYLLFLERLDTILLAVKDPSVLRDRLDAQGLAWTVANLPVEDLHGWSAVDRAAFEGWRTGKPVATTESEPAASVKPTDALSDLEELPDTLESLASDLYMESTEWLEETLTLLKHKLQLILQGPPGTGKTYIARALANYVAGSPERVTTVQFHPGTSYEDFVQGLRPHPDNPGEFRVLDGPLVRISKDAARDRDNIYVLLIDEINRGNVPAIFGELYFLLEYRDHAMALMYGDVHSLPDNLLIIGTMNTADRSITALDSALRRRFYVRTLTPQGDPLQGILRAYLEDRDPSLLWLADLLDLANTNLNDRDLAIGSSHFMGSNLSLDWARRAWDNSVLPTLEEYFHSKPERLAAFEFETLRAQVQGDGDDDSAVD